MKTQIKVTSAQHYDIEVTTLHDNLTGKKFIPGEKKVSAHIVFPDDAFYMEITFPMGADVRVTETNVMKILRERLFDMDDVIFKEL